jgi:hypothetical protein
MSATATTDIAAAVGFLEQRFGEVHTGYAVLGFIKDGATTHGYINLQAPDRWERAAHIIERHIETHDCYAAVGVFKETKRRNPATGRDEFRTTDMIAFVNALYLERDAARYPDALPPPSYTVETSTGSFQDYLSLGEHIDAETAGRYLRGVAAAAGLGNQAVDAARLLRMPGTCNRKANRNGEIVTVVADSGAVYRLADFEHLPQVATGPAPRSVSNGASDERKIPEGARHNELVRAAGSMRHYGIGQEHIYEALAGMNVEQCVPPLEDDEVRRIADSANWKPEPPPAIRKSKPTNGTHPDEKPAVDPETGEILSASLPAINAGNPHIPTLAALAWAAIQAKNDPERLFRHAGTLSRLEIEDGRAVTQPLTISKLRYELGDAAEWYKETKGGPVKADVPLRVAEEMLAHPNPPLPILERIVHAPFFAFDGRLVTAAGYDKGSRTLLLLAKDLNIPLVPDVPTATDVQRARDLILDNLLSDFPFVDQADRANAVAAMLLLPARLMITGSTPIHLFEAASAGSGKGLCVDVVTRPFVGAHVGVISGASQDDEWRKRISAKLREGAAVILADNITTTIDSGALASAVTADVWTDRLLGTNETMSVPVRCHWLMTANNPTMTTEIARRTIRIRIDPKQDRPWQRTGFRHTNLIAWTEEHRADLVHAALVLIQAWIAAGKPKGTVTLGSFERWATVMGGILDSAGIPGFLTNLDEFYEAADLEGAIWRQFVAVWWDAFKDGEVGAKSLFNLTDQVEGFDVGKGFEGGKAQRTAFGMQLSKQRDRVIGEHRIVFARVAQKAKMWRLVPTTIKPLIPDDESPPIDTVVEKGSPPVSPCHTKGNEERGEPRGTFQPSPRVEKTEQEVIDIPMGGECQKVPQGSPSADSSTDFPLPRKEKSGGEPFSEGSPDAPMARLELEAWARDIASGWGCAPHDLVRARVAARALLALDLPEDASAEMAAALIVAALEDRPR